MPVICYAFKASLALWSIKVTVNAVGILKEIFDYQCQMS